MKIKITKASKYHAQGQVVECPKSVGFRFIALGKAVEYNDNEDQQDELEDSGSTQAPVLIPEEEKSIDESSLASLQAEPQPQKETSPTPRRKRKPRKKRST